MPTILHINDNNILHQAESVIQAGQGYAWLKNDSVTFDTDANANPVRYCRLAPQEIHNRYWQQCDQSAIAANRAGMRHAGDLIWRHLGELNTLHPLDGAVFAVPSHYREANLQLLLGIARSHNLAVSGVVNKAVLAIASKAHLVGDYLHIDVQLHQTVVSRLSCLDGRLSLVEFDLLQDVGIHAIQEALLKGLQTSFIQSDRFDPLHDAGTEQQLFDQLPVIAKQIAGSGKANVAVQHRERLHSISLEAKEWHDLLNPFLQRLLQVAAQGKFVDVFVDLNALFDEVVPSQLVASKLTALTVAGPVSNVLDQLLTDDEIRFITSMPVDQSADNGSSANPALETNSPAPTTPNQETVNGDGHPLTATHVLCAGTATALDQAHVAAKANNLTVAKGEANVAQLLEKGRLFILNDEKRKQLRPNDRLGSHVADGVLTVIRVV